MSRRPRSILSRFFALVRGSLRGWVRDREEQSPRAVYEEAIVDRTRHYADLKRAVAGILYMRNKLDGEIHEVRNALAQIHEDIRIALRKGDDAAALALVRRKQGFVAELERAEQEVDHIRAEAEEAKGNLVRFRDEIRNLEREKVRMLATLANANARRRIQETLDGFSVEGEMRALESVREYVARVRTEGRLEEEIDASDTGLQHRIREIRADAQEDAARRELQELKHRMEPAVLAPETTAEVVDAGVAVPVAAQG
jgi:phage shock protein A